jgi:hypothetical protein
MIEASGWSMKWAQSFPASDRPAWGTVSSRMDQAGRRGTELKHGASEHYYRYREVNHYAGDVDQRPTNGADAMKAASECLLTSFTHLEVQ